MRRAARTLNAIDFDKIVRIFSERDICATIDAALCMRRMARQRYAQTGDSHTYVNSTFAEIGLHEGVTDEFSDVAASRRAVDGLFEQPFRLGAKRIEERTERPLFGFDFFPLEIGGMRIGISKEFLSQHGITQIVTRVIPMHDATICSRASAISPGTC